MPRFLKLLYCLFMCFSFHSLNVQIVSDHMQHDGQEGHMTATDLETVDFLGTSRDGHQAGLGLSLLSMGDDTLTRC